MKSIKKQLMSGIFFTALAKYSNMVVSLIVTSVLARLLAPEQFGVIAVATVAISLLNLLADIGLSPTVIQHRELDKQGLSSLFSLSSYIAALLSFLFFICAGFFATYYGQPILKPICQLLSISLFFSSLSVVPNALFYRERMFKFIAIRSLLVQLVGGTLSIVFAYRGGGIYALVVNPIFSSFAIFLISYFHFPLTFRFRLSLGPLKYLFSYSLFQFLFNIINYFSRNADTLMIGKYLGMVWLGYYDKSYRLMSLPLQNITQVITPVIHPVLSQYEKDKSFLLKANETLISLLAIIGFPLSVFLYFSARELILLFFGSKWTEAVPSFQLLSLTVGLQLILSSSGSIFQTARDTKSLFICGLFSAILNVAGIILGVFYFKTIEAVAACLAVTFSVNFIQAYWQMYRMIFGQSILNVFRLLIKPVLFSIVFAIIIYFIDYYIDHETYLLTLLIKSSIYAICFGAFLLLGDYKKAIQQFIKRS